MMLANLNLLAVSLLQGESVGFSLLEMWEASGVIAKLTLIVLVIMSAWSIGVMIDRLLAYSAARKQSRAVVPLITGCLQEGKLGEALEVAEANSKSHLAKVIGSGIKEFNDSGKGGDIESCKRALDRSTAITTAELKRGVSGLATIGSTAPFVGLFGTVIGIINAFQGMSTAKTTGLSAVAGGISEALIATALGLFVAIPAIWVFNYFNGKLEAFSIEMDNSSSELIDYFLKRSDS